MEYGDIPFVCGRLDVFGQFNMKFNETKNPHRTTGLSGVEQSELFESPKNTVYAGVAAY